MTQLVQALAEVHVEHGNMLSTINCDNEIEIIGLLVHDVIVPPAEYFQVGQAVHEEALLL